MQLNDMEKVQKIRVINRHARASRTFRALDHCADLARQQGVWKYCEPDIHERNMRMLGKPGYGDAAYRKGWHVTVVTDEHATFKSGKRVHARELSKRGYRFIGTI